MRERETWRKTEIERGMIEGEIGRESEIDLRRKNVKEREKGIAYSTDPSAALVKKKKKKKKQKNTPPPYDTASL